MPTMGGGRPDAQNETRASKRAPSSLLRLPKPLLERVRWTFLHFSLISACLLMVAVLARHDSSVAVKAVGIVALAGLSWLWVEEYRLPLSARWDLVEGAALVAVGVAVGNPLYMLLLLYGRLSFRSFSSSIRQAVTAGIIFFAAFFAPVLILPSSGGEFSLQLVFLASGFPLCVTIMNTLHQTLDRLERSVEREQVLREAGAALVAATDKADIYVPSVRAALDLLGTDAATAAMVAVVDKNGALRTVAAGPDGQIRGTDVNRALPEGMSKRLRQGAPFALTGASASALVATLGFPSEADVAVIPFLLRRAIGGAIFVALSGPLPEESVTSLQAVGTQLGLAIDRANLTDELHERRSEERFRSL
ncbi:MAG: hypothetical protein JOZ04_09270, partial [Acidimicrobiia bacterium]|nr:hypothetical protein [Acidimicrobiia bacterium]